MKRDVVLRLVFTLSAAFIYPANAWANDLGRLFSEHFYHHYEERRCGDNAQRFIEAIDERFQSAASVYLVVIEDTGFSNFGMVQAEMARWPGREGQTQDMNWGYHAFVMDRSGKVYDFDYNHKPTIQNIRDYLESMFIDDNECNQGQVRRSAGDTCVSRDTRLSEYKITVVPGDRVLDRDESVKRVLKLGDAWKDWRRMLVQ
jgi:hypothetical protein